MLEQHHASKGLLEVVDARGFLRDVRERVLEELGHPERPQFYAAG